MLQNIGKKDHLTGLNLIIKMYWFKELEKYGKYFRRELIENEDYELINYN